MALFRRRGGGDAPSLRVYYASDIHGTEVLWRKFLNAPKVYKARVLVMGGDITGKMVIPIVAERDGTWSATLFERRERMHSEAEVEALEKRIRANGMYPHRMTADEVRRVAELSEQAREQWFAEVMLVTFERWLALAEERLAGAPEQLGDVGAAVLDERHDHLAGHVAAHHQHARLVHARGVQELAPQRLGPVDVGGVVEADGLTAVRLSSDPAKPHSGGSSR